MISFNDLCIKKYLTRLYTRKCVILLAPKKNLFEYCHILAKGHYS